MRRNIYLCIASVVVFTTTYMLILPAITESTATYCGQEEHTHTSACYETTKKLVCDQEESDGHQHTDDCYKTVKELVCGEEESDGHQHSDACYTEEKVLTCTNTDEDHEHDDSCYTIEKTLTCGMEEGEGAHHHTDDCYKETKELVCGMEEGDGAHHHTDKCYKKKKKLTCDKEEHTHTTICYSNPNADVESKATWEKSVSNVTLTGNWSDDVLAIAKSQLGYQESTRNYEVDDNDHKKGYSRYGDWYGVKYGDWCAMFVSFCLNYADIPTTESAAVEDDNNDEIYMPIEASCQNWIKKLNKKATPYYYAYNDDNGYSLVNDPDDYTMETGDLIFFNWDSESDADHVGLIEKINYNEDGSIKNFTTIEGNSSNCVKENSYTLSDSKIMGFAKLPSNPEYEEEESKDSTEEAKEEVSEEETETETEKETETEEIAETETETEEETEQETETEDNSFEASTTLDDGIVIAVNGTKDSLQENVPAAETEETIVSEETEEAMETIVSEETVETEEAKETIVSEENIEMEDNEFTGNEEPEITVEARALSSQETAELLEEYDQELDPLTEITLYDITLLKDGQAIEPSDEVTLTISGMEISEEDKLGLVHFDEETKEVETMDCDVAKDGTLTAQTDHFSVYGITNAAATGTAISGNKTFQNLANGGTYYLTKDITVTASVTITQDTTLNLNGYKITFTGTGNMITVQSGTFTLEDNQETAETVTTASVTDNWGNTATYNNGTLTYYVTVPTVTNSSTGATTETVEKHVVTAKGLIECSGASATPIQITGGTFTMKSGMIAGSTRRAIYASNATSTINLEGGYICGNDVSNATQKSGGAVYCAGNQTVNLSGTVIAGNTATMTGGGIYIINGTLNIKDNGIISGNTCTNANKTDWGESTNTGGAGVYSESSTVNMTGGYVTNNKYSGTGAYFDGGGGFLVKKGTLNISNNAKITGNYSGCGGGAVKTARSNATTVNMTGGFVSSNYAGGAEGGGMNFDNSGVGYITAGYITNNSTNKEAFEHWGGGGLFCSDGAQLYVEKVIVTENSAGGYGGGVAGCSTGRVYICVENGGAIFDNSASGQNLSGKASAKSADREYAAKSSVFLNNGYKDYYCALTSSVDGGMLGNGTANWTGSMDGVAVTSNSKNDVLVAANIMGLTANPSDTDKTNAESAAAVYINGNYSFTHGGGILANGYLLIGKFSEVSVPARLSIMGTKQYLDGSDPTKDYLLKANLGTDEDTYPKFHFTMVDSEGDIVATGTNGWDNDTVANATNYNRITFDKPISLTSAGTFTYTIYETDETNESNVVNDSNKFTIVITTQAVAMSSIKDAEGNTVSRSQIQITNVTITDSSGKEWYNGDPGDDQMHIVNMPMSSTGFVNYKNNKINYKVTKTWYDGDSKHTNDSVNVQLYRNDAVATDVTDNTVTLNNAGDWSYEWKNLPLTDSSGNAYKYSVKEVTTEGYSAGYETTTSNVISTSQESQTVAAGDYWVPVTSGSDLGDTTYLIVSNDAKHIFYIDADNKDTTNTNTFVKSIAGNTGSIKINGTTYSSWISDSLVTSNNQFKRQYYSNKKCYVFRNQYVESYISNQYDDYIKTTNGDQYGGAVKLVNGKLMIQSKAMANAYSSSSTFRYVTFENGIFGASSSSDNAVVLYKKVTLSNNTKATVDVNNGLTSTMTTTITNYSNSAESPMPFKFKLNIHKVSAENTSMALKDAKFNLLDSDGNVMKFTQGTDGYYTPDDNGSEELLISSITGYIHVKDLPSGTYTLRETMAPTGYDKADDQTIVLNWSTWSQTGTTKDLQVEDPVYVEKYSLPMTGGSGTTPYTLGGLLLIAAALVLYSFRTWRRHERRLK